MAKHTQGTIWVSQTCGKPDIRGWMAAGKGNTEIAYFKNPHDAQLFKAAPALLGAIIALRDYPKLSEDVRDRLDKIIGLVS